MLKYVSFCLLCLIGNESGSCMTPKMLFWIYLPINLQNKDIIDNKKPVRTNPLYLHVTNISHTCISCLFIYFYKSNSCLHKICQISQVETAMHLDPLSTGSEDAAESCSLCKYQTTYNVQNHLFIKKKHLKY